MSLHLKPISKAGIPEAIAKVDLYRSLNEPEEAESICRDILAVDPAHQLALRLLGLAIPRKVSTNSAIPTSAPTTPDCCTNGAPKRSCVPAVCRTR
jgi:hypothetical protein